ncbi:MAG: protease inhibitor I42 family protein [Acidaminococcaceae bacterium]|nr:protease inhibitor I42 family protein [Acidaminococcaceae bacterium]
MKKTICLCLAAALLFCQSVFADQPTTVLTELKNGKQIVMEVPVIDGANNETLQRSANSLLRSAAVDAADKVGKQGNVTYEVTLNRPSLVSILLKATNRGRSYYRGVNIDLTTGREFGLDDFFFGGEGREKLLGKNADNVLFTENGVALAEKNGAAYDRVFSYQDLLPLSRIGDIGRLMSVWKLTENSDGKILTIKQGELFAFKLNANPSTGFQWVNTVSGGPANGIVKTGSSFMIPNSQKEQVGTPGIEFQFYAAKAPGTYQMKLSYQRPWEKLNGIRECNVTVIVK